MICIWLWSWFMLLWFLSCICSICTLKAFKWLSILSKEMVLFHIFCTCDVLTPYFTKLQCRVRPLKIKKVDWRILELFFQVLVRPHVRGRYPFVILAYEDLSNIRSIVYPILCSLDFIVVSPIWCIDILLAKSNTYSLDGFYMRQVLE